MHKIILLALAMLVSNGVQAEDSFLYIESSLPSKIQAKYEVKLSENIVELLNVNYNVFPLCPYIRLTRNSRSKSYQLVRFPGSGWQAYHVKGKNIFGILDNEIERPGHVFSIIKIAGNGKIIHVGDIKKIQYYETHLSSKIEGQKLIVTTRNDLCEKIQKTTYEFDLKNHSTKTLNKSRPC